jgi:hypothetical protein
MGVGCGYVIDVYSRRISATDDEEKINKEINKLKMGSK